MAAKRTRTSLAEHFSETWQSIALAGVDGILGEASRLFSGQGGRVKTDVGDAMTVYHAPFAACTLKDVFDDGFLEGVKSEFVLQRFVPKSNDLYHFEQTGDFKKAADTGAVAPLLKTLRSAIYSDAFMSVIETIAGVKLRRETMDISGHRYRDGVPLDSCFSSQLNLDRAELSVVSRRRARGTQDRIHFVPRAKGLVRGGRRPP